MSHYTHFITDGSGTTEVFPLEFSGRDFRFKRKKDDGQIFYRVEINGRIAFTNKNEGGTNDYDYFNSIEVDPNRRCEQLIYTVKKFCDGEHRTFWSGIIVTSKGFFDKDECRFEVKPEINDRYNCLLSEWDRELNILDVPAVINTSAVILPDYEYLVCRRDDSLTEGDMISWSMWFCIPNSGTWEHLYYNQIRYGCDAFETVMVWARQFTFTACIAGVCQMPTGTGWVLDIDDCGVSGLCRWVRKPQGFINARQHAQNYINYGSCTGSFGTVDELPPPKVFLDVELSTPPVIAGQHNNSFPRIWGYKSGCAGRYEYKIINHMGAVGFTWTVGGSLGGTIFSGQGTDTLIIDTNTPLNLPPTGNTVTIDCDIAMNPSGNPHTVTQFILFITLGSSHFGEPFLGIGELLGPEEICIGEANVRFEYPRMHNCGGGAGTPSFNISRLDEFLSGQVLLILGTDYTISSGGGALDGFIEVSFNPLIKPSTSDVNNPTKVPLRINISCLSSDGFAGSDCIYVNSANLDFTYIRYLPNTSPIYGSEACEPSAADCHYRVWPRFNSTYEWEVTGGTITSGQGTNQIIVEWGTDAAIYCVSVKETMITCCSTLVQLSECGEDGRPPFYWCIISSTQEYSRNRWLIGAIEWMWQQINCDPTRVIQSDFFEWNPVGDAPGYVPGNNYVTGLINQMDLLTISQKSDVIDPNASNPATKGMWSLKKAFDVLLEMFEVYWDIDANGNMRLEHVSFFEYGLGLDLTLPAHEQHVRALNKYEHRNPEYPKFQRYKWAEALGVDFIGADIEYSGECVTTEEDSQVEEHNPEQITTDIDFIVQAPDEISKDGFVIMANYDTGGGIYQVIMDAGLISNQQINNAPLSWANLHFAFHRHDRYLPTGRMNIQNQTFITYKPTIRQVPISIYFCCEILSFDPRKRVRTELGQQYLNLIDAEVETAEFSVKKETLKLVLLYSY